MDAEWRPVLNDAERVPTILQVIWNVLIWYLHTSTAVAHNMQGMHMNCTLDLLQMCDVHPV